jgi:O-acetyl-ADP-ribose deacetylase (regulator of RNase III)
MPRYYAHVVVATGRSDWASKIEFDTVDAGGGLAGRLKALQSARGSGLRDVRFPSILAGSVGTDS